MTVWQTLENENCYAVAIYNFAGTKSPRHLQLDVGELVHLERETHSWYWGRSLRKNVSGAFPKNFVVIRECVVDRCGDTVVASAGGSGVVHDIAVTLREWMQHWKKLYSYTQRNDERFKFIEVSMRALLELRAQIASGALPQDQLRKVSRTAVFTIDRGNRNLDMVLAVRCPNGQLVNPLEMSTYKLNSLHEETNTRIDKNMETTPVTPPTSNTGAARSFTICVRVYNFVCRMNDPAELLLALYDALGNKLTDHLLLRWPLHPAHHMYTTQLVFTDLGSDIKRGKVFLVCQVVRIGSLDTQAIDHRRSSVAQNFTISQNSSSGIRRPFGVACRDVTQLLGSSDPEQHIQLPFFACEKETMDSLLKKLIANRELKDTKHSQGLWVTMQMVEGDIGQIPEKMPHMMVGNTAVARKIGFPEVILPGDARNDLYVTICQGSFSKGGKSSERNIELTARVVDRNGEILPGVISVGAGAALVSEYTSLVYYHDDRPRWHELFKVCLSIEQFKEAHLVFLCRHRSSNEAKDKTQGHFALSYLRLMQREGTTTPDRVNNLCVYKIHANDNKRDNPAELEMKAAYCCLGLPSRKDELPAGAERGLKVGMLSLVHRDSLTVATKLCSTKLTQREEILGVLKWSVTPENLREALERLLQVPSEELVKFLQDILDALFNILTQVEEDEEEYNDRSYGILVLNNLLRVIALVSDHKYQHFQPVLHVYIDKSFSDALAYEKLILVMTWVIKSARHGEVAAKRLLHCMKCLECLIKIIVRSRELRSSMGDSIADAQFKNQFESLLEALVELMSYGDPLLTCQGSALKYLPHAVPHVLSVYPDTDLSAYIVRALETLALSRLSKQRVSALLELVRGPLCEAPAARALLLPHVADTLAAMLRDKAELDRDAAHKSRSVDKAARLLGADSSRLQDHTHHQQIVELCVETLGEVFTLLARDDVGPVEADRQELARILLPTVLHTAAVMLKERDDGGVDENLLRRIVCVLLDMVRQMTEEQYGGVVRALQAEARATPLLDDALQLLAALLHAPVFKPHWADMLQLQHYVMLHALKLISTTLLERLQNLEEGDEVRVHSMLRRWFDTISALATSEAIQMEKFPPARLQRTRALFGDLRRTAADVLAEMWFSLGEHKRAFIPCLVGPFLEVSFLPDEEVRNTTIPLFFDMMQTEYTHSVESGETDGHLKEMESEVIEKLDVICAAGYGDASWRARFVSLCGALCARSGAGLRSEGAALVAAAARQLDTLLHYRAARPHVLVAHTHRMHLITTVLDFYQQIKRPHMYIRYVHRLVEMHREAGQWAEAGLALRLHATLLRWTHETLPPRLRHPDRAPDTYSTHRELKENLYLEVSNLLNQGRQWELAVEIVKELVTVYEEEALGYAPLAELHTQLATLYTAILRTPRSHPGYFRVIYHGHGFPEHLRVPNGFIYRGNEYEQLSDFNERLLNEWPDAEVLLKLDPPGEEITQANGQYLQVNAVNPVMGDKLKRLSGKPVAEQIRKYYQHNNVAKFEFNRPFHRPEESLDGSNDDLSVQNEFATRWLERTELEISDTLPGILRWSAIVNQRTYWVSPVEAAVEALREINRTLKALAMEARAPDAPLHPLTMRLSGILDPAVQGGIVNYERAFLTPAYEARHPEHKELLQQLKDLIADQIPILNFGLEVHQARAPVEMEALHQHMVQCFHRIKHHVHQRYGRKNCDFDPEILEVQLRMQISRDSLEAEPTNTNNRISDISTGNDSATKKFFGFSLQTNMPLRNSNVSYFGTLQSPQKRRAKRRQGKSDLGMQASASQWYTTPNGSTNNISSSNNNTPTSNGTPLPETPSPSPLRELRQEAGIAGKLVTERPLRADVEREKRLSQRASLLTSSQPPSNRDSMGTTDSNQDDEEPPPLPQKSTYRYSDVDTENNNQELNPLPPRHSYDMVIAPRGSFLYNSMAHRRHTTNSRVDKTDKAPTPPPKKKNLQNNNNCTP